MPQADLVACNAQLIGRNSAAQTAEARCDALSRENDELRREAAALRKEAEVEATRQRCAPPQSCSGPISPTQFQLRDFNLGAS